MTVELNKQGHGWLRKLGFFLLVLALTTRLLQASDKFEPKVTRIDTLLQPKAEKKGKHKGNNGIGGFSHRIVRFDDSHQLLALTTDYELKFSPTSGESWEKSNVPKKVKSLKNIPKDKLKKWKEILDDENYFIPGHIWIDYFHGSKRAFISPYGSEYEILITENKGSSFEVISLKKEYESGLKRLIENTQGSEKYTVLYFWLASIETNSDYDNILITYDIELTKGDKKNPADLYLQLSLISTDKGRSFDFINPISREFNSVSCTFLDKETDNKVSTTDILCQETSEMVDDDTEHMNSQEFRSSLVKSSDSGKSFEVIPDLQDMLISWFDINYPYISVYVSLDKFNLHGSKDLLISNDLGKSFQKAIIPSTDMPNLNEKYGGVHAYTSGDIMVLSVSSYNPPADSAGEYNRDYYKQTTFISDSTGLKFLPLKDAINHDYDTTVGDSYESIDQLFNFKGVFTSAKSKINYVFDENSHNVSEVKLVLHPSFITFDDGANWESLNIKNDDSFACNPEINNSCYFRSVGGSQDMLYAEYFTSHGDFVLTPGIASIRGIVSEGSELDVMNFQYKAMTFLTRDFGKSWEKIFDHAVILAYGDYGNIIVAIHGDPNADGDSQQEFYYSFDQGKTWDEYEFKGEKDGESIFWGDVEPLIQDGSGFQFIASGFSLDGHTFDSNYHFILDFSHAFEGKKCDSNDFENVILNEGKCIDGQKFTYKRRKRESECLARTEYKNLLADIEICDCTEDDFECSVNFRKDVEGKCVLDLAYITSSGVCLKSNSDVEVFVKQLKNNDACKKSNQFIIEKQAIHCKDLGISRGDDKIIINEYTSFDSEVTKYEYFNTWQQDSILVRTAKGTLYISTNGGDFFKKFDLLGPNEKIIEILFNKYHGNYAYVLSSENNLFVTSNGGKDFLKYSNAIPTETIQLMFPLDASNTDPNKLIYYGGANCENIFNKDCHAVAYITKNGGKSFEKLLDNAVHCEFSGSLFAHSNEDLIICEVKEKNSKLTSIVSSTDYFNNDKTVNFDKSSVGFVTYKDFTVIANVEDEHLSGYITMNGKEFAKVKLPKLFDDFDQRSFTIAGSSAGSIIMHLTTESASGLEYGALLKSNNNGTSFVTIERAVNRNNKGFIDFEYVGDLEGVFITNIVSNPGNENKKLKTKISFNNGALFRYLEPPVKDYNGKKYSCSSSDLEKCSLNLHSYTDRVDFRDTLSSGAGTGLLIGVGNVGENLLAYEDCSTFLSTDGGISWKEINDKPYQYEFGDRSNLIVLVSNEETDSIIYSKDQGNTWKTLKVVENPVLIKDIITNPTDSSLKFLLILEDYTISINFAQLFKRQCSFDNKNDFEYKPLAHPDSKCIFGHEIEYIVKKNVDCFVGMAPLKDKYRITKNCTCTRDDYECDYNYEISNSGVCKLVEGLSPLDPLEKCAKDPDLIEVFNPTGYRKNSLSTCKGGKVLDIPSTLPQACPGKEEEFRKLHLISSKSTIFLVILSMCLMAFTLWIVYERGIKRNGGFSRFGEIRLSDGSDEDDIIEENISDVIINRIVSFGVVGFYGLSNIYSNIGKSGGKILNKFVHIIGLRRSGLRNQDYSSVSTGNRFNTFADNSDEEDNSGVHDDLLFGNDEDADNIADFNDEDMNFDIDEHLNDHNSSFLPYNDHESTAEAPEDSKPN